MPMYSLMLTQDQFDVMIEVLDAFHSDQKEYLDSGHFHRDYVDADDRESKASQLRTAAEVCELLNALYLASQLDELAAEANPTEPEPGRGTPAWHAAKDKHEADMERES
jgi:hypothetical protein